MGEGLGDITRVNNKFTVEWYGMRTEYHPEALHVARIILAGYWQAIKELIRVIPRRTTGTIMGSGGIGMGSTKGY